MGFAYKYGEGLEQSDKEAVRWYRQAADQGHAAAQFRLGVVYEDGQSPFCSVTPIWGIYKSPRPNP